MNRIFRDLDNVTDIVSMMLFLAAAYFCLDSTVQDTALELLGVAFLISFMYGVIAKYNEKKFIFGK